MYKCSHCGAITPEDCSCHIPKPMYKWEIPTNPDVSTTIWFTSVKHAAQTMARLPKYPMVMPIMRPTREMLDEEKDEYDKYYGEEVLHQREQDYIDATPPEDFESQFINLD